MENNITYLNKNFSDFKSNLINYTKTYFPATYNDFSEASPGMMFIEMAAYVGDVLSFYLDTQFQENLPLYTKEKENIMSIAYALGHRPQMSYASSTTVDIYQQVPALVSASTISPDLSYCLTIPENTPLKTFSGIQRFITTQNVDFSDTGSADVSLFNNDYFLIKKSVKVVSGEIKTTSFTFTTPVKFNSVVIDDDKILQILRVTDASSNVWYEVPYLAQEIVDVSSNNPNYISDDVEYILSYQQVPRRFVSRFKSNGDLEVQFGAGTSTRTDSQILPTPDTTQLGIVPSISGLENNYNKVAYVFAKQYGLAPSNTTLTFEYLVGGGLTSNVAAGDINNFVNTVTTSSFNSAPANPLIATYILSNLIVNNPLPSTGGRDGDSVEEIRMNTLYSFSSQNRAVTAEDYTLRTLSLPTKYGSIAKAYTVQDLSTLSNQNASLSIYTLAYNTDKKLTTASSTLKNNLKTYLKNYKLVNDVVNIKDAFYVNIQINFDVRTTAGSNNNEVINNCINALSSYFNIDKWQINQPIILSEVNAELLKVKGVLAVSKLEIVNKATDDGLYSPYRYNINAATRNGAVYPSVDPCIFEVRYPLSGDIKGRVVI